MESVPKLKSEILELTKFLARHFFLRLSDAIKLVLPKCVRLDTQKEQTTYTVSLIMDFETAVNIIGKKAKNQLSAVAFLCENGRYPRSQRHEADRIQARRKSCRASVQRRGTGGHAQRRYEHDMQWRNLLH